MAYGSQGPDISVIPAIALHQVEVLRDGAAAQYGSDAIAGVMNFPLKDARSGGSVELNTGMYGAGDGEAAQFAGNVGLPMGGSGFANLSLEYGNSNPTDRAAPRRDCARRGRQHARPLRASAGLGATRTSILWNGVALGGEDRLAARMFTLI